MLFISPQKFFSFSKYLIFCLDFLDMYRNSLISMISLISKLMTSQPGKQTVGKHIFPNISRSKGNQRMKFSQLIDCNITNNFLEKSYTKFGGETIPRPFYTKIKIKYIPGSIVQSFIQFLLIVCQVGGYQNTLKLRRRPPALTARRDFWKTKRSGTSLLP